MSRVLLVGASGRLPFNGHALVRVGSDAVPGHVALRVSASRTPPEAWDDVTSLSADLRELSADTPGELIDAIRTRILQAPDDCAALVTASDGERTLWWGHGLDAVRVDGAPADVPAEPAELTGHAEGLGAGDTPPEEWT